MSDSDAPRFSELRADLVRVAHQPDVVERTLEVVALIDAIAEPLDIHPVIVGGMAVYFWAARDEFLTYDVDIVMEVPVELDRRLTELGFVRTPDGRHWTLELADDLKTGRMPPGSDVLYEIARTAIEAKYHSERP
jgi:hypothetical protein